MAAATTTTTAASPPGDSQVDSGSGVIVGKDNRRKWDNEYFKKLQSSGDTPSSSSSSSSSPISSIDGKKEIVPPEERVAISHRTEAVDFSKDIGKRRVITDKSGEIDRVKSGFYCATCDCVLKDSVSFLDHLNGRTHAARMGFNLKTEKASAQQVREKLLGKRRQRETLEPTPRSSILSSQSFDLDSQLKQMEEEEILLKEMRKDKNKKKKLERKQKQREEEEEEGTCSFSSMFFKIMGEKSQDSLSE